MVKRQNASTGEFVDDGTGQAAAGGDKKTPGKRMHLRVQAPFKTYFDGDVYSVSGANATGPFDILPGHHNFISILKAGQLDIDGVATGQQKIIISGGLIHVKSDQIIVFLDV